MLLNPLLHLRHWVLASHHHRYFITAKFAVLFCPGVDSFHFRAAWILSTPRLIVIVIVLLVVIVFVVDIVQRSERREQPQESRCRQPDVVNSVAISALDRI